MNSWHRSNEISLPDKGKNLHQPNYGKHNRYCLQTHKKYEKAVKKKNLGEYHDLHVQTDTLLLADIFENVPNKCLELFALNPASFFIRTRINMTSMF